ncbi:BnaC05g30440D [Brassica napus]|uniref:BnaC05g30440D protein n=1 Tax=Brassica napus TaxID=3708 RepID=A0A078HI16_BRANA|nr:BnaC05g30440D [Brassica napus]
MFLQESRGTFDDRRKLEDATTLPERRKDQAEIGTKATAQRKSRRQRSNQTGKGSRREAVVITGEPYKSLTLELEEAYFIYVYS